MSLNANFDVSKYSNATPGAKYNFIEESFVGWESNTMPMSMRILIQAQLSAQTITNDSPLGDNRSIRVKSLMAGTVGAAGTCVARITRLAAWTVLGITLGTAVRYSTSSRYEIDGAMAEFGKRYLEEFIDAGTTILSIPLGITKTFSPTAFADKVDAIALYYMNRAKRRIAFDERFEAKKAAYSENVRKANTVQKEKIA